MANEPKPDETVVDDVEVLHGEPEEAAEAPDLQEAAAAPSPPAPYVAPKPPTEVDNSPSGLLAVAVARGASVEELDKLLALKERFDAEEARKAYTAAMALFKQNAPQIFKDKKVTYDTADGTTTYHHATLGQVANVIASSLGEYGLSHGWSMEQQDNLISVTCTITHEAGHSESTTLAAGPDTSGKKNPIQAVASTVTYLERYTLLAITGMAAHEADDDGELGGQEFITPEQVQELEGLIEAIVNKNGKFMERSFYRGLGLKNVPEEDWSLEIIPARRFAQARKILGVKANG